MSLGPAAGTALAAPTNVSPPVILNTSPQVGNTLTILQGIWVGASSISDEWESCDAHSMCTPVGTGTSYTVSHDDAGDTLKVAETATAADNSTSEQDSSSTSQVPPVPQNTQPPVIASTPAPYVGNTLTFTPGTWSNATSITDIWEDCDSSGQNCVPTATTATYQLSPSDYGHTIVVQETADDSGTAADGPVASTPTAIVTYVPPALDRSNPPRIEGNPQDGSTLTESHGTWNPAASSYTDAWQRCDGSGHNCTDIAGATGQSYTATSADVGHTLEVQEIAYNQQTPGAPASTPAFGPILPLAPADASLPAISGTAAEGATLTADPGTWSSSPTSYTYQWQRCDGSGQSCAAIDGAAGQGYTATADDVGHTLVVAVSGVNAVGTGPAAFSSPSALVTTTSTSSVSVSPSAPVANQSVTLTAVVTPHAAGGVPAGTVRFADQETTVAGCDAQPVTAAPQGATATCQTTFAAGVRLISVAFSPSAGSAVTGSDSPQARAFVGRDPTTTSLDVTSKVKVGERTTFTATVAHSTLPGTLAPVGTVEFMDAGKPIAGCARQSLVAGGATCTTKYAKAGGHSIRARFGGDANFLSSSSPSRGLRVIALPVKGRITATMQWTFHYTPSYTEVVAMVINGVPTGGVVHAHCTGKGCPFSTRTTTVRKAKPCVKRKRGACPAPGRVSLTGPFGHHRLKVGAQITIVIQRPQYIGKYYNFLVRARRQPRVHIDCLAVDGTTPGVGC